MFDPVSYTHLDVYKRQVLFWFSYATLVRVPAVLMSTPFSWIAVVKLPVPPATVPVVVMLSAPVSMAPKPEVIEPAPKAPVPVMAVATASLVSTRAASLPSRRLNSTSVTVTPLMLKTFPAALVTLRRPVPVSYTHLDVYKRQV